MILKNLYNSVIYILDQDRTKSGDIGEAIESTIDWPIGQNPDPYKLASTIIALQKSKGSKNVVEYCLTEYQTSDRIGYKVLSFEEA